MSLPVGTKLAFKPEFTEIITSMLAAGKSLKDITKALGVDLMTLNNWRLSDPKLDSECSRAMSLGFEVLADSLIEIPELVEDVNRARLKSDNIKWVLARRAASKYGDRLDINVTQTVDIRSALDEAKRRALPASYQTEAIDAELVVTKELSHVASTDNESVAPEIRDAVPNSLEDLLK